MFLYEQNADICCVTETWLTSVVPNSLICPSGYVAFRRDRETPGGGVAIFVKYIISSVTIDIPVHFNHIEVVCLDLSFQVLFVVLYVSIVVLVSVILMFLT